jgi:hypothetical protein
MTGRRGKVKEVLVNHKLYINKETYKYAVYIIDQCINGLSKSPLVCWPVPETTSKKGKPHGRLMKGVC